MDVNDIPTPTYELQTSTESAFPYQYATLTPLDIQIIDRVPETNTYNTDRIFLLCGMGGILIFFVIFMICYSYVLNRKDVAPQQEIELGQLNGRSSQISYLHPMDDGSIYIEDVNETGSRSLGVPALAESSCYTERKPKYLEKEQDIRITDLPQIAYRNPQEILAGKYSAEDNKCPNTDRETDETSGAVSQRSENRDALGRVESLMSESQQSISSSYDSTKRIFSSEDFKDLLYPKPAVVQEQESADEYKSDENATPTKSDENRSPSAPKGKSHSSPTSPEVVRRRITKPEDAPRRPSSWQ